MKKGLYIVILYISVLFFCQCKENNDPNNIEKEISTEEPTPDENDNNEPDPEDNNTDKIKGVVEELENTSCFQIDARRKKAFDKIQEFADACSVNYFQSYLRCPVAAAENYERKDSILALYRLSFEKNLDQIKKTVVKEGTVVIWHIYNMGYVVKTPSACFAIDICHKYAARLAPYIDFLCVTHNHPDHYDNDLIQAMFAANKPVLSNYLKLNENYKYTSTIPTSYKIGKFNITTNINDHHSTLKNFVTTFQINCGDDTNNFVLMHVGDSYYIASQYSIKEDVDVMIIHYSGIPLTENNVIGKVVFPKYVLMAHILELTHEEKNRWSLKQGLERSEKIDCRNTYMPFWSEKLVWKNGRLN